MEQVGYWKDGHGALSPPEYSFIECGCGCELHDGESVYTWDSEKLCEECLRDRVLTMPLGQLADALGLLCEVVRF